MTSKGIKQFLASTAIFILVWLPVWIVSIVAVPLMLWMDWTGYTTWFGNFKWGRGITHYKAKATTFWKQWWFLCMRNPVSNLSTTVLSVSASKNWVWLVDKKIVGNFYWLYGWKNPSGEMPERRTFVYRPWFHTDKNFKSSTNTTK